MEVKQAPAKLPESEEEQEKVIKLLEERLEKHDLNRKVVQSKLTEILNELTGQIDYLEERINRRLEERFISEDDRLQATLNGLRVNMTASALQKAKAEFSVIQSYDIIENKFGSKRDITTLYELKTEKRSVPEDNSVGLAILEMNSSTHSSSNTTEMSEIVCDPKFAEERERLIELLKERLQTHYENRKAAQDKLHEICEGLRTQIDELEDKVNKELEGKFTSEDNRLQTALNELRGNRAASALQKAKAELLVEQLYKILENNSDSKRDITTLYELKVERRIVPELMEMRKLTNVHVTGVDRGIVSVGFACLNPDEERVLSDKAIVNPVKYKCLLFKKWNEQESKEYPLDKDEDNKSSSFAFTPNTLEAETTYRIRVKMVVEDRESEWSDGIAEFTTPEFRECCVWKECPDDVDNNGKYVVDEKNPRIATKANSCGWCAIIGNTLIPPKAVTSWSIKVLKSKYNDGDFIFIGVAPFDINQNEDEYYKCGWCFDCYFSTLCSGPPHNYDNKRYGPRKDEGQYVRTGDSVGVVVDTTKGNLSFVLDGVDYDIAYYGIPLDKPLVSYVVLFWQDDSVELVI